MRVGRISAISALCAVMALLAFGVFGTPAGLTPAGATTPQWQTTASFAPLVNVRAVSCAPNSGSGPTTCVAVGDNGNNVPSIVVTNDGGSTWSPVAPPPGVSALTSVSCPSNSVCYAVADT